MTNYPGSQPAAMLLISQDQQQEDMEVQAAGGIVTRMERNRQADKSVGSSPGL
ncbi:MAG: hypothetical protein HYX73_04945 [Acidobacteria bacterium]|nr:hypothetical protein [Acidobacteriota bacterium]